MQHRLSCVVLFQASSHAVLAAKVDDGHTHLFHLFDADPGVVDLEPNKRIMDDILNGTALCETCLAPASHICASTDTSVFLCAAHVESLHGACKDVFDLSRLRVPVLESDVENLKGDPDLIIGAAFSNASGQTFTVLSMDMEKQDASAWEATVQLAGEKRTQKMKLEVLEKMDIVTRRKHVNQFFALSKSWVLAQFHTNCELYGLAGKIKGLHPTHARVIRDFIAQGSMDEAMQYMARKKLSLRWLPHLATMPDSSRATEHLVTPTATSAAMQGAATDTSATEPLTAAAAGTTTPRTDAAPDLGPRGLAKPKCASKEQQYGMAPLTMGAKAMGGLAWSNRAHDARALAMLRDGDGVGVGQCFVGFENNVCAFGVHAESRSGDFVNGLAPGSDNGA